jgi:hypothetical protein
MNKKAYTVEVLVNGKPIKEHLYNGETYIEAREGTKYSIKVKNHSLSRIKAVITVDGFSVVTDDKTDQETGYIINGYDTLHVKGFRTSENEESVFVFKKKGESRAQKALGYAKNCGVIGVKIYREQIKFGEYNLPMWKYSDKWYDQYKVYPMTIGDFGNTFQTFCVDDSSMQYSCNVNDTQPEIKYGILRGQSMNYCHVDDYQPNFSLGTGMGEDVESKVEYVDFQTGNLHETFELYYLHKSEMVKMGISFETKKQLYKPQAFPKFCKKI